MRYFIPIPEKVFSEMKSNYYQQWLDELKQHHPDAKNKRNAASENKSYSEYNYSGKM